MRVLLTGCAGFIGTNLLRALLSRGYEVVGVDNFITSSSKNIEMFLNNPNFKFLEHDISQPLYLDEDIDWVLHFASPASPAHYFKYPIKTLKAGMLGTYNCLGIAKAKKARFFLASTSEVYGDPLAHPQKEDYYGNVNPIGERSCYDESKRVAEALTFAYHRKHQINIRVARIFNTYGPHMRPDDGRVVSNFIVQCLRNEDLTIYGDGKQTRSFCYIDDLVEAITRYMDADYSGPLNLGNPQEFTVLKLAELVRSLTSSSSNIKFLPALEDDPQRRCPDIGLAKKLLNWEPEIPLEEGLRRTVDYFRERIK